MALRSITLALGLIVSFASWAASEPGDTQKPASPTTQTQPASSVSVGDKTPTSNEASSSQKEDGGARKPDLAEYCRQNVC